MSGYRENARNMGGEQPTDPSSPIATPGLVRALYDQAGALMNATALPAAGAYRRSEILDVRRYRRGGIWLAYDAAAASGYPDVIVLVSGDDGASPGTGRMDTLPVPPNKDADVWYALGQWTFTATDAALTGALVATTAPTQAPPWRRAVLGPLVLNTQPATANGNKVRIVDGLDLTSARWMMVQAAEVGATGSPGTLGIKVNFTP